MKSRLPRLQFSLRTLVIVVVLVAALASWHGSRYARYKARATAIPELQSLGIELRKADHFEQVKKPPGELTWVERWDAYWFGAQATEKFTELTLVSNGDEFVAALKANSFQRGAELIANFPELEDVYISYTVDSFTAHKTLPRLPADFLLALARLPKLQILSLDYPAVIDDEWAAAFPRHSPLQRLDLKQVEMKPATAFKFLEKTPGLKFLEIDQHSLDEHVVELLNRQFAQAPKIMEVTGEEGPAMYLNIRLADEAVEDCLRGLRVPFSLNCKHKPTTELEIPVLRLNLVQQTAERISCEGKIELLIQDCPQVESIGIEDYVYRMPRTKIVNCPQLTHLHAVRVNSIQLERLPKLPWATFSDCTQIDVRDCSTLKHINVELPMAAYQKGPIPGKLTMADLPRLETLYCTMLDFESRNTPLLKHVALDEVTPGQLACLAELKTAERLALRCARFLPYDQYAGFRRLSNIRYLILDRCISSEPGDLLNPVEDLLPPNLEVLVCRRTSEEMQDIQKQRPQLRLKALFDINPATQEPWIEQYGGYLHHYLDKDEFFAPAASQKETGQ